MVHFAVTKVLLSLTGNDAPQSAGICSSSFLGVKVFGPCFGVCVCADGGRLCVFSSACCVLSAELRPGGSVCVCLRGGLLNYGWR